MKFPVIGYFVEYMESENTDLFLIYRELLLHQRVLSLDEWVPRRKVDEDRAGHVRLQKSSD